MILPIGVEKSIDFGDRDEADVAPFQTVQRLQGDHQVAGEAVELVDHDHVDAAGLGVVEHPGERGALRAFSPSGRRWPSSRYSAATSQPWAAQ